MEALGLYVEDGVGRDIRALVVLEPRGEAALVGCLHGDQGVQEVLVVVRGEKPLELVGVRLPSLADARADEL